MRELQATIAFTIVSRAAPTDDIESQMDDAIIQGSNAIEQMKPVSTPLEHLEGTADHVDVGIDNSTSIVDAWTPLLTKIELFTRIVNQIAEV
jgi:hypothetical protein